MGKRIGVGTGVSVGAILALPATATAGDFKVNNLNDSGTGSLRAALEGASMSLDPADRVLFKSKLSGEITLTSGRLEVNGPLEIAGPGARRLTVSGNDDSQIFHIATGDGANVTISGLRLVGGQTASRGGAIASYNADLTVSAATISGNTTSTFAGGIFAASGSLTVRSSTISGNRATGGCCGGVSSYENTGGTVIQDSTISGNSGSENIGGVYIGSFFAGPVEGEVRNSTIARNSAGGDGGGIFGYQADIELAGSIVAHNTAGGDGPDIFGLSTAFAGPFNLIENLDGESVPGSGNIFGQDPKLKPLKNNGGPTDTHAFKRSPAKNKLPKGQTPKSDQRGAPRKGKGDIGAYELVKCEGVIVNRVGTPKKDKLKGTKRKDGILGLGGNDKLSGKRGKDGLCGGRGKDKLRGGPGKDKLDGGPGKDKEIQ